MGRERHGVEHDGGAAYNPPPTVSEHLDNVGAFWVGAFLVGTFWAAALMARPGCGERNGKRGERSRLAGTNSEATESRIEGPAFVLVEPQLGENIGAACRAMWNFGLDDLRLVAPRDGWPNPAAVAMASGATRVLDRARVFPSTADATAELSWVCATTARPRDLTKTVLTPEQACAEMARRMAAGEGVGVLFGRERTGLENSDIIAVNAIVSVPANPAFGSLNLAQCALLMGYEWRRRYLSETSGATVAVEPGDQPASRAAVDQLYAHLEGDLDAANYFWPEHKRSAMAAALRNLLSRTPLTDADARMLHGVIRALAEKPRTRGRA